MIVSQGRNALAVGLALGALVFGWSASGLAAAKSDYCYTPPGIGNDLKPNVMLVLDNSGSMYNFAYDFQDADSNGFADPYASSSLGGSYDDHPSTGFDPNETYFGYFKPDYYYTYSSSKFQESRQKSAGSINSGEWDGNFLNWLTMRRVDILRKVLTGGDFNANSNTIVGAGPDGDYRGAYKELGGSQNVGDFTPCSGSDKIFNVSTQGGTAVFDGSGNTSCPENSYKIQVQSSTTPSGLLDDVYEKVRFGLAFYAEENQSGSGDSSYQGGNIVRPLGTGSNTLSDLRSSVNEKSPETATPLAETLWTVTGYFAQETSATAMPEVTGGYDPDYGENRYSTSTDTKDPFRYDPDDKPAGWAPCAQNFVLFLTDGEPTRDDEMPEFANAPGSDLADLDGDGSSDNFADVALYGRSTDLRSGIKDGVDFDPATQHLNLYTVFAFGQGSDLIKKAAMNGGYEDLDGSTGPYTSSDCELGEDNTGAHRFCNEWDEDRDGVPDTYFEADNAKKLQDSLRQALNNILKRASSGSTVATISTQTRSGGELLQAYYLPFQSELGSAGTANVAWKGFLRGLWTDPAGNIREDDSLDDQLKLEEDRIIRFQFVSNEEGVLAYLFPDSDGDNVPETCDITSAQVAEQESVNVKSLWEAGQILSERDPATRQIWFNPDDSGVAGANGMADFTTSNASEIQPYWTANGTTPSPISASETEDLIKFLRGYDNPNGNSDFRQRQADDWSTSDYWGSGSGEDSPWKLGAIITSTPRVLRSGAVSTYSDANGSYRSYYQSSTVQDRPSMAFVGANDGMLHAFYVGDVEANTTNSDVTADLEPEGAGKAAGKEAWAFIPENALPYLRWYAGLDVSCHIPTVDYRTQVIDVAMGGSWKTLLVGTMGFGGRSITCNDVTGDGNQDVLSSSIFVLDITDPENPELLWEKAYPDTSLTLTYPSVVHKGGDLTAGSWYLIAGSGPLNVAGAGPNDPGSPAFVTDPSLYVFNLSDGSMARRMKLTDGASFADSAKALASDPGVALGELVPLDPDRDDITDSVLFGTYSDAGGGNGKLYRLQMPTEGTSGWNLREAAIIPANTESNSIAGRPFFGAPGAAKDEFDNLWIYGATGRYIGEADITANEDPQFIFGYTEDCWGDGTNDEQAEGGSPTNCSSAGPVEVQNDLVRTDGITVTGTGSNLQCRCGSIKFDPPNYDSSNNSYSCPSGSEKVITDVKAVSYNCDTNATNSGASCTSESALRKSVRTNGGWYHHLTGDERVFSQPFVRAGLVNVLGFVPSQGLCAYGGTSYAYGLDYRTGTAPPKPVYLNSAGFTGDMDTSGTIKTRITLGKGVPPLGEGFAAMPSTGEGEVGSLTQTSTGEITKTQQQTDKLKSGILFLRSP